MTINQLKNIILEAFVNVKLGDGISLRQSHALDYSQGYLTPEQYRAFPKTEITDRWHAIPLEELEEYANVAYLDPEGYRYYLPALMISILDDYQSCSMRVIGTVHSLCPTRAAPYDDWDRYMTRYALLSEKQKQAVAIFMAELPNLVPLELSDSRAIPRAVRNYWGQFLPSTYQ